MQIHTSVMQQHTLIAVGTAGWITVVISNFLKLLKYFCVYLIFFKLKICHDKGEPNSFPQECVTTFDIDIGGKTWFTLENL